MIAVPSADPVGALVPHTLKEPLIGGSSGPLAGTSFMVKDLFAIKGRKVSNGSPDFYEHETPARETAPVIMRLLEAGASCTGITVCDEFFYSVLGSNIHYGQPVNARAPKHVTGGSSCGAAAAVAASMCNFALGTTPRARRRPGRLQEAQSEADRGETGPSHPQCGVLVEADRCWRRSSVLRSSRAERHNGPLRTYRYGERCRARGSVAGQSQTPGASSWIAPNLVGYSR